MKKNIYLALSFVLGMLLAGCANPYLMRTCATCQKGTTWTSEDGRITFFVDENDSVTAVCPVFGTIETEDGTIEVAIFMDYLDFDIGVSAADHPGLFDDDPLNPCEEVWRYSEAQTHSFVIEVVDGYYLKTGEIIQFYRVDE